MSTEPAWDHFRTFLSVLRRGSLSAAARDLRLSQPTVGRQIAALEKALGCGALFTRSPGGLLPTRVALDLQPHAETMATTAATILRASSGAGAMKGTVKLSVTDMIGIEVLPPALRNFSARHTGIALELSLSNENADLLKRDADIAIRMVQPSQKALFAKKVGRVALGMHAHRRYLDQHPMPTRLEDLAHHVVIGFDRVPAYARNLRIGGQPITREAFNFRCDNDAGQLAALRAGIGIGVCQYGIARRNSDLVPILTREFTLQYDTWVVMHEDQKGVERVRSLFDHLADAMREYCASAGPPRG